MRRLGLLLGAALLYLGLGLLRSRRLTRVAVSGHSMEPGLRAGDCLILTGTIGDHGMAVMATRHGLGPIVGISLIRHAKTSLRTRISFIRSGGK